MNLLELLQQGAPIDEVAKYLEKQLKISQTHMTKTVKAIDPTSKKSVLRMAFENLDFNKMQLLLDFDAHDLAANGFPTCEDEAHTLLKTTEDESKKSILKKIIALLHTRRVWNDQQNSFFLNRSMRVFASAQKKIINLFGECPSLFIGITGHGKSTLIDFLLGVDYRYNGKVLEKVDPLAVEPAKVGLTSASETLYPSGYRYLDSYLVDMAGFEGTRDAEKFCVAAGTRMFTKPLAGIKKIVFVCDNATLDDSRLVNYRPTAAKIGRMVLGNPEAIDSVVLAVTKSEIGQQDVNVMINEVRAKLLKFFNNELEDVPAEVDGDYSNDPEYLDKIAIRCVTEALLREGKIIIADVSLPATREKFQIILNPPKNVAIEQYNFSNFDPDMRNFLAKTKNIREYYANLKQKIAALIVQGNDLQQVLSNRRSTVQEKKQKLNELIKERDRPFDPEQYDRNIQANNDEQWRLSTVISRIKTILEHLNEKKNLHVAEAKRIVQRNEATMVQRVLPAHMQIENERLTYLTRDMKGQAEVIDVALNEMLAEANQHLLGVQQQYDVCERRKKPLLENKRQALANYENIKANTPGLIAALESEIVTLEQEISQHVTTVNENADQLENYNYEIEVNETFLDHINKIFEVLEDSQVLRNGATVSGGGVFAFGQQSGQLQNDGSARMVAGM